MTDTQVTQAVQTEAPSAEVKAREAEIVTAALAWAQGDYFTAARVTEALRSVGLGEHLPRESAEVTVHVTGTVTVRCEPDGSWTQESALRALQEAVYDHRAVVEATEVAPAPSAE